MIPILFPADATEFTSNGLGRLTEVVRDSVSVTEEINGAFEASFRYPIIGSLYEQIALRNIVVIKPNQDDDPQPFRICKISRPMNGAVTVSLQHLSYDLSYIVVQPFTSAGIQEAVNDLPQNSAVNCPFTFSSDKTSSNTFTVSVPSSIRSVMGGQAGSLLDVYAGEFHYDGFEVELLTRRGSNRGVSVRYSKNLLSVNQTEQDTIFNAVYPYWIDPETMEVVDMGENKIVSADGTFTQTMVRPLDLTSEFDERPSAEDLETYAANYIINNEITSPKTSLTLSWVRLEQTEEYENLQILEKVALGDTIQVYYPSLGINATARINRVIYDPIMERYRSADLGNVRASIADTIYSNQKETEENEQKQISFLSKAQAGVTARMIGEHGGFVLLHDSNSDGYPDELLIMDTDDIQTASNVWRWNENGLGFSSSGYNGTYATAITADGQIVADFITTGSLDAVRANITNLTASMIHGGTLVLGEEQDVAGKIQIYDENNNLIGQMDSGGLRMYGADGSYVLFNNTDGFKGFDALNQPIFWASADQFHMEKAVIESEITLCDEMRFIRIEILNQDQTIKSRGIALVSVNTAE